MSFRRLGVVAAVLAASSAALTVGGAVSDPASYTLSQLQALPAEKVRLPSPNGRGVLDATGVSLDSLVTTASMT